MKTNKISTIAIAFILVLSFSESAFAEITLHDAHIGDGTSSGGETLSILFINITSATIKVNEQNETITEGHTNEIGNTSTYIRVNEIHYNDSTELRSVNITIFGLGCEAYEPITYINETFEISPKNQDDIADYFYIDLKPFTLIDIRPFKNNISYDVIFRDNNNTIIENISRTNVKDINFIWNGTTNGIYAEDGIYDVCLYLMYENTTLKRNKTINMGNVSIDNTPPEFIIQNNTPIITPEHNFTLNLTFSDDTLYWKVNDVERNGTTKNTSITYAGRHDSFIPGDTWTSCSYDIPEKHIGFKQSVYCYGSASGGGSSSCGSSSGSTSCFGEGHNSIIITAYDNLRNKKTETIPIYIDLIDEPDESYIYLGFSRYWNSFFLPTIILEDIPVLNNDYSISNVLYSLEDNYEIVYYHDEHINQWLSYNPNRPINDLTQFIDNGNKPYWIKMKESDTLVIR